MPEIEQSESGSGPESESRPDSVSAPTIGKAWESRLRFLPVDWDGIGGKQITEAAIEAVKGVYATPTNAGGIQLEVHQDGYYIKIEFDQNGKLSSTTSGDTMGGYLWINTGQLRKWKPRIHIEGEKGSGE